MNIARPLAIHLDPYQDESWNGYLDRVAVTHRVEIGQLRRLLRIGPHGNVRDHGVAMLPETIHGLAHVLGQPAERLHSMLLVRFATALTAPGSGLVRRFDPSARGGPVSRTAATSLGWLRIRPGTFGCVACLREHPQRWLLSWRLPWHLVCERHRRALTYLDARRSARLSMRVDTGLLAAQQRMLAAAYEPPTEQTAAFIAQVCAVLELLCAHETNWRSSWTSAGPPPRLVARHLSVAVGLVDGAGYEAVGDCRDALFSAATAQRRAVAVFARYQLPPHAELRRQLDPYRLAGLPSPAAISVPRLTPEVPYGALPQQLPMTLFVGGLSDLLYPLPIEQGRVVAAVMATLVRGGSLGTALAELELLATLFDDIHAQWARLRAHGREEVLLEAARDAAEQAATIGTSYAKRRWLARRHGAALSTQVARALDGMLDVGSVRGWLRYVWAGNVRPGPRGLATLCDVRTSEPFDQFDAVHHDVLTGALDTAIGCARFRTRRGETVAAA